MSANSSTQLHSPKSSLKARHARQVSKGLALTSDCLCMDLNSKSLDFAREPNRKS